MEVRQKKILKQNTIVIRNTEKLLIAKRKRRNKGH
jgi:hypothetical protein